VDSEEEPTARGLGVFEGTIRRLPPGVKHPQMQWNILQRVGNAADSKLLAGLGEEPWVYFVHSYAPEVRDETVAVCDYGGAIGAAVERDNVWGTQFHPEKSGKSGLALLANFAAQCAAAPAMR
jgi:glutamine amidotransferase